MERALLLAERGLGFVAPNPLVGCVIVHNDLIIGEGWHREFGKEHAEVNAIHSVENNELLPYSTLYVTLEPCNHQGKTPPCTDLILKYKIPEVIIASSDPNPLVAGKGIEKLKTNNVKVKTGILERESRLLNRRFFTFHEKKRPYIILKWAETSDGVIDKERQRGETGSFQISSEETGSLVHRWRSEEAAILVGKTTAIIDDPFLTARKWPGKNPIRVLIDPSLKVSKDAHILDGAVKTIIFNRLETKTIFNNQFVQLDFSKNVLPDIMMFLHYEGIQSVIVEGGARTLDYFIEAGLWDEARIIRSPLMLGKGLKSPAIPEGKSRISCVGKDMLIEVIKVSE